MPPKKSNKKASSASTVSHSRSIVSIDPSLVYFTHARIRPVFTGCNKRIEETLREVEEGRTKVEDIPKITVLTNGGHLFSLNNRRLFLFKELSRRGLLQTVTVQLKEATEKEKARYTPERCVLQAKLMKDLPTRGADAEGEEEEEEENEVVEEEG
eukprot:gene3705-4053_t